MACGLRGIWADPEQPDPACEGLELVPHEAKERDVKVALTNSFGFGGTNVSLIFQRH